MGKGKGKSIRHGPMPGSHAKEKHKRRICDGKQNAGPVLNGRLEIPNVKSKHRSYYELVENKDKKKKLEFKITNDKTPPPGFEFVPIGNPELTTACKELSREQDAMIFIVSMDRRSAPTSISHQVNRVGHHVRQSIVEQARAAIGDSDTSSLGQPFGQPEPIPESQQEINDQADKAIRDLFPRIPNTDRQAIIEHSFKKGATKKGEPLVGLAKNITLSRRAQLAVLAHVRHVHTRYDQLLKETSYANARKAVESVCLDFLVKWRGDEETGRDQLEEILREVIVISDSEDEEDDGDESDSSTESSSSVEEIPRPDISFPSRSVSRMPQPAADTLSSDESLTYHPAQNLAATPYYDTPSYRLEPLSHRRSRRGFKRYQAALVTRWDQARDRVRLQEAPPARPFNPLADRPGVHYDPQQQEPPYPIAGAPPYYEPQMPPGHRDVLRERGPPLSQETEAPRRITRYVDETYRSRNHTPQYRTSPYEHRSVQMLRHASGSTSALPYRPAHPYPTPGSSNTSFVADGQDSPIFIRAEQAKDYLVPSVEPPSPAVPPAPPGPVFVRQVSPWHASRPRGDIGEESSANFDKRRSPGWGGDEHTSGARRHMPDDEASAAWHPPRQEPVRQYLVSDSRRGPPATSCVEEHVPGIPDRVPAEERRPTLPTHVITQPHPEPGPLRPRQAYDLHGADIREPEPPSRVLGVWARQAPPEPYPRSHSRYELRPGAPTMEMRRDLVPQRDGTMETYPVPDRTNEDGPAHYQPLHYNTPGPRQYVEMRPAYDPYVAADGRPMPQPVEYRPAPYPALESRPLNINSAPMPEVGLVGSYQPVALPPRQHQYASDMNMRPSPRKENAELYRREPSYKPWPAGPPSDLPNYSNSTHGYPDAPPDIAPVQGYCEQYEPQYIPPQQTRQAVQGDWPPRTAY